MKKKKQLTSLLLASAMLLSMLPIQAAAADTVEDTAPETVVVSGTEDLPEYDSYFSSGEISMPQLGELANSGTVMDWQENEISYVFDPDTKTMTLSGAGEINGTHTKQLFELLKQAKRVVIEDGITAIGYDAFSGRWDYSVYPYVHDEYSNIQEISLPDSLTRISVYAFKGTAISSICIPANVAEISYSTFAGCNQLTDISFGNGSNYKSQDGAILDQQGETLVYIFHAGSYTIPNGVKTIASEALCKPGLTSVTIPKSVDTLEGCAAWGSGSLTTVTFEDPSSTVFFRREVFARCTALSSINLPNPITTRGFWESDETIAELGYHMFIGCSSLKNISIPSSVKTFANTPFVYSGLASVTIPNGTTTIAAGAFQSMYNLTSVFLPASVTTIKCAAFGSCNKLTDVYYCGDETSWKQVGIDRSTDSWENSNEALTNATVHYGHRWSDWTVTKAPTLEEEGEQIRTCTTCGATDTAALDKLPCPFTDVTNPKAYYYDAVLWAVDNGVTNGTTTTTFSPNDSCNRGQIVVFLWRLAGKPTATNRNNPFTDVKEGDYCYEAVLWAVENGITNGATTTTFAPRRTCNRGEIVTFLWRYAGKPQAKNQKNQFTDVKKGSFCYDAVLWAVENKITLGRTATTFEPKSTCVRGHAVTFLFRAKDLFGQQ